jgi:hypothetical protein
LIGGGTFPVSTNDVYGTFPHSFTSEEITQTNCSTAATISVTGPVTLTTTSLPCTNGSISGVISGQFSGPGAAVFTVSGSGVTATHTEDIYGPITVTTTGTGTASTTTGSDSSVSSGSVSVTTVPSTIPVTISQPGPAAVSFTSSLNCSNVSSATNYDSFIGLGAVGTFQSSAASYAIDVAAAPSYAPGTAPTTAPPYACLLTVSGLAGSQSSTSTSATSSSAYEVQLQISVTSVSVGVQSHHRQIETSPGQRRIPSKGN